MKHFYIAFLSIFSFALSSCNFAKPIDETPKSNDEEVINPTSVTLNYTKLTLEVGDSATIIPTVLPENAGNKNITWSIEDRGYIAFYRSTGIVEGLKAGKAYIKAYSEKNKSLFAECEITVVSGQAPIEQIKYTYKNYSSEGQYKIHACPSKGNINFLVLPIWFTDSNKYIKEENKNTVLEDINTAFFGNSGSTGWESVSTFFKKESRGRCNISGVVSPWYECGNNANYYTKENVTSLSKDPTVKLVKQAVDNYFSTTNDSRNKYDSDNDGYLDSVILIFASADYKQDPTLNSNLWAYTHWIQDSVVEGSIIPNAYLWASYDFMYDKNNVIAKTGTNYASGKCINTILDTHTYIHEIGHIFGLEDYYCYNNIAQPAACFSMQDLNVGGHDPYSLLALGWINPFVPKNSCTIKIKPFQDSNQVILLTPNWNKYNSAFDEYLLLEFYTPTGLNKLDMDNKYSNNYTSVADYGIRLWHVDARLTYSRYKSESWVYNEELINHPDQIPTEKENSKILTAFTNTYYSTATPNNNGYCSPLGKINSKYYSYNLLELIRKTPLSNEYPLGVFDKSSLYVKNDSFNISTHPQFKNSGLLNNNINLGFSFKVVDITSGESPLATIEITKL